MENEQEKYQKGFNQGYNLKKYHPDLYTKIIGAMTENTGYKESLTDGAKQFDKEQIQHQMQESIKNKRYKRTR